MCLLQNSPSLNYLQPANETDSLRAEFVFPKLPHQLWIITQYLALPKGDWLVEAHNHVQSFHAICLENSLFKRKANLLNFEEYYSSFRLEKAQRSWMLTTIMNWNSSRVMDAGQNGLWWACWYDSTCFSLNVNISCFHSLRGRDFKTVCQES